MYNTKAPGPSCFDGRANIRCTRHSSSLPPCSKLIGNDDVPPTRLLFIGEKSGAQDGRGRYSPSYYIINSLSSPPLSEHTLDWMAREEISPSVIIPPISIYFIYQTDSIDIPSFIHPPIVWSTSVKTITVWIWRLRVFLLFILVMEKEMDGTSP